MKNGNCYSCMNIFSVGDLGRLLGAAHTGALLFNLKERFGYPASVAHEIPTTGVFSLQGFYLQIS